jgi:hypothetical protein
LAEGDYHLGVGALANSLHKSGFRGKFFCGYRGKLPHWFRKDMGGVEDSGIMQADGMEVIYVPLETTMHFTNFKPRFMLNLLGGMAQNANKIYYIDPDIVVKCSLKTLERWSNDGVALCQGSMGFLPRRHPLRIGWLEWLQTWMPATFVERDSYYNAGFVGIERKSAHFLKLWENIIGQVSNAISTNKKLTIGNRDDIFYIPDEYALNMALMCMDIPVNASGREGMDFCPQGNLLSHAGGAFKAWRTKFILQALRGTAPVIGARLFGKNLTKPIQVFSDKDRRWFEFRLNVAANISRFVKPKEFRWN